MRPRLRARSDLRQIWYMPAKWLMRCGARRPITRSAETDVSIQHRCHDPPPAPAPSGESCASSQPSSVAHSCTTSYLQCATLMRITTGGFRRRPRRRGGDGASSLELVPLSSSLSARCSGRSNRAAPGMRIVLRGMLKNLLTSTPVDFPSSGRKAASTWGRTEIPCLPYWRRLQNFWITRGSEPCPSPVGVQRLRELEGRFPPCS